MSSSHLIVVLPFILVLQLWTCSSQTFDPNVGDKDYLDTIQKRLQQESIRAHVKLVNQTKILQQVTRSFIESKIKENLFKAVRERVEMELEEMAKVNGTTDASTNSTSNRQARQDEDDDDDVTTRRPPPGRPGLLPQLANVVSTFFGANANFTGYVTDATNFLPPDLSNRIVSAASLIDPNRFTSTTTPPPLIINGQVVPQGAFINGTYVYSQGSGVQYPNFAQQQGQNFAGQVSNGQINVPNSANNNNNNNQNVYQQSGAPFYSQTQQQQYQPQQQQYQPQQQQYQPQQQQYQPQQQQFQQQQQQYQQPDVATYIPQQNGVGTVETLHYPNQPINNDTTRHSLQAPLPLPQPGTLQQPLLQQTQAQPQPPGILQQPLLQQTQALHQQPDYNIPSGPVGASVQVQSLTNPVPNFKVNDAFIPAPRASPRPTAASSNEDESSSGENTSAERNNKGVKNPLDEENSAEDDLPAARIARAVLTGSAELLDDEPVPDSPDGSVVGGLGYLDEYPAVKYAINLFNHFASRQTIPTTTEFVLTSTLNASEPIVEYEDEELKAGAPPATQASTYKRVVEGGKVIFQGAKQAYNLLAQINGYFDRINTRLENAGYGAEDVGLDV